jgi:hypothetical protein
LHLSLLSQANLNTFTLSAPLELPKKDVLRGRILREQGRLEEVEGEEEAVGRRGGNNPVTGEALRAISMAISTLLLLSSSFGSTITVHSIQHSLELQNTLCNNVRM